LPKCGPNRMHLQYHNSSYSYIHCGAARRHTILLSCFKIIHWFLYSAAFLVTRTHYIQKTNIKKLKPMRGSPTLYNVRYLKMEFHTYQYSGDGLRCHLPGILVTCSHVVAAVVTLTLVVRASRSIGHFLLTLTLHVGFVFIALGLHFPSFFSAATLVGFI